MLDVIHKLREWADMLADAYRNKDWARVAQVVQEMEEYDHEVL